ncbi:helix-turn-helix domain-containing protein [Streptomyces sp. SS]|uniref:helix-turn-helix domain-containing protein n=1 Tax=Streptomyces sp. SS TaxID=260742 RepID=UPI000315A769|nr:helix-turn-helix domain-containing protein [Streptomyces sp. SS]
MRVERRDDGNLVFGYLDTASADLSGASDTVLVRARTGDEGYAADMRPSRFGALSGCDISGEQEIRVMPRPSPAAPRPGHLLGLLVSGRGELEQDGRLAALAPGDFVLYTGARPFRLELGSSHRYFVLSLDAATAGHLASADGAVTANAALPRSPSGRVLAAMVGELAERAHGFGPLARRDMGEHVSAILRTLLREASGAGAAPASGAAGVFDRILGYVDERLADDLSPGAIAAAHHISVRHLHALFRESGTTVGDHVRRRRLERIRRDLLDPALSHLPAYVLAARSGLGEASHFSRVFRAEFGLSPRALRARTGTGTA